MQQKPSLSSNRLVLAMLIGLMLALGSAIFFAHLFRQRSARAPCRVHRRPKAPLRTPSEPGFERIRIRGGRPTSMEA